MEHILFICNEYPPSNHGGIGSFTKDLSEALVENNFKVSVIGFYNKNVLDLKKRETIERINNVTIYRNRYINYFKNNKINNILNRIQLYNKIKKIHQKDKLSLIEAPEFGGWILKKLKNVPLITRLHSSSTFINVELNKKYSKFLYFLEKRQLNNSDYIISVSNYVAQRTLDIFNINKPYTIIYNAVKDNVFRVVEKENTQSKLVNGDYILFVGTINPLKGVEQLIKSMINVWQKYPDIKLVLAGKDNKIINGQLYKKYLLSLIPGTKKKNVIFTGHINREKQLYPLIKNAKLCCMPSYVEAFSIAPLEAMAFGKAVIYSKYHSGPEIINDGYNGLLCDPMNINDISSKIELLLSNDNLRKTIEFNARKTINDKFSYNKWIKENIDFYTKVIKNEI